MGREPDSSGNDCGHDRFFGGQESELGNLTDTICSDSCPDVEVRIYQMMEEGFELISGPSAIEIIAVNLSVRERDKLKKRFGGRRWRKLKGVGRVRFPDGNIYKAEVRWYEAHGVGRRKMKVKRILE